MSHDDKADSETNWLSALAISSMLEELDLHPLICDSNGKGGYHVGLFFKKPVASEIARWLGVIVNDRLERFWFSQG